jgi:hypothetical protein
LSLPYDGAPAAGAPAGGASAARPARRYRLKAEQLYNHVSKRLLKFREGCRCDILLL